MRATTRHFLSLVVTGAFAALALGTSKPSPEEEKRRADEQAQLRVLHDEWVKKVGRGYEKISSMARAGITAKACDGPAMLALAKETHQLRLPTVHGPFLARFASANKGDWQDDKGTWAFLTDSTFRGHFSKHASERDAYAIDGTARFIKNDWQKNRFLIVLWPDDEKANRLPSIDGKKSFESGSFKGWLVMLDSVDESVVCQQPLSVDSSEKVTSGQTFNKDPQKAVEKDFQDRFEAQIEAALPPKVKSTTNMGSLLK